MGLRGRVILRTARCWCSKKFVCRIPQEARTTRCTTCPTPTKATAPMSRIMRLFSGAVFRNSAAPSATAIPASDAVAHKSTRPNPSTSPARTEGCQPSASAGKAPRSPGCPRCPRARPSGWARPARVGRRVPGARRPRGRTCRSPTTPRSAPASPKDGSTRPRARRPRPRKGYAHDPSPRSAPLRVSSPVLLQGWPMPSRATHWPSVRPP
jgi:hypothetical protein